MNKKLRFSLLTLLLAVFSGVWADSYVKVTSTANITNGTYLIVYETNDVAFDGSLSTLDAVSNTVDVTIANGEIEATDDLDASAFTIDVANGTLKSASGYYIGVSSNSNGLKQTEDATAYTHTFSIDDSGNAEIFANFSGSTMSLRFNKASNQDRFRYYKNAGQEAIQLYKKVSDDAVPVATINGITPTTVIPGQLDHFTVDFTPATGAEYTITWASSDENKLRISNATDTFGDCVVGDEECIVEVTVTITPTGENANNFTAVSETVEVSIADPRQPCVTGGAIAPTTIDMGEGTTGTMTITYDCVAPTNTITGTWSSSNPDVLDVTEQGQYEAKAEGTVIVSSTFVCSDNNYKSVTFSQEVTVIDPNKPGTENNPYTVAQALEFIESLNGATSESVYVKGIVSSEPSYSGGTGTYWISDDGTSSDLQIYKGSYYGGAFGGVNVVNLGDIVVVKGQLMKYNGTTPEFKTGTGDVVEHIIRTPIAQYIKDFTPTEVNINSEGSFGFNWAPAEGTNTDDYEIVLSTESNLLTIESTPTYHTYTVGSETGEAYVTVTVIATDQEHYSNVSKDFKVTVKDGREEAGIAFDPEEVTANVGDEELDVEFVNPNNLEVTIESSDENVVKYENDAWVIGEAGTATVTATFEGNDEYLPATATLTVKVIDPDKVHYYKKITSTDELVGTATYLIVNETASVAFDGSLETLDVTNNYREVEIVDGTITVYDDFYFTLDAGKVMSASGHSIGVTSYGNGVKQDQNFAAQSPTFDSNGNVLFTISFDSGDMILNYNKDSNQKRFRYFKNGNQEPVQLYIEVDEILPTIDETKELDLEDGEYEKVELIYTTKAGWNTIALPFKVESLWFINPNAKVYDYDGLDEEGNLQFVEHTNEFLIEDTPYVFYVETAPTQNSFKFEDVTIYNEPASWNEDFIATFKPMSMAGKYGVVPSTGQIKKGGPNSTIKAFRGYFELPAAGEAANAIFHNADGTTTSIKAVELLNDLNGDVYDLGGRKVNGTLQPGVYVKDGKKVVVK